MWLLDLWLGTLWYSDCLHDYGLKDQLKFDLWLMAILKLSGDRVVVPMAMSHGNVPMTSSWASSKDRRWEWGRRREEAGWL